MQTEWNLVKEYSTIEDKQKLSVWTAIIIIVLSFVIVFYQHKLDLKDAIIDKKQVEKEKILQDQILFINKKNAEYEAVMFNLKKLEKK